MTQRSNAQILKCPCCGGTGTLVILIPREEGDYTETTAGCCHCSGSGEIFADNRSDNRHE